MEITDEKEIALVMAHREENRVKMETARRRANFLREVAEMLEAGVPYLTGSVLRYLINKKGSNDESSNFMIIYDSIVSIMPERK